MKRPNTLVVKHILDSISRYYNISEDNLCHGNRERIYSEPRQVASYCLYKYAGMSYWGIARLFNKRSHRTIIYAVDKVADWIEMPALNRKAVQCVEFVLKYD